MPIWKLVLFLAAKNPYLWSRPMSQGNIWQYRKISQRTSQQDTKGTIYLNRWGVEDPARPLGLCGKPRGSHVNTHRPLGLLRRLPRVSGSSTKNTTWIRPEG